MHSFSIQWNILSQALCFLFLQILFSNCDPNGEHNHILSVDTIHCRVHELSDFELRKEFSSHKFSLKAALSYEIGIALFRKKVCWLNGPFPAAVNDITIYRQALMDKIPIGKKVIADRMYMSEASPGDTISCRNRFDTPEVKEFKKRGRARHETFNAGIKKFACMREWRHEFEKHVIAFEAIIVVLQCNLDCGDELFNLLED